MPETNFTDQNFSEEVLKADKPVLVDFWAPWCGPCRVQGPIVETLAQHYAGRNNLKIGKMNVDENPIVAQRYQILSIPTVKIFKNGQIVENLIGLQTKESLQKRIETHI